MLSRCLDNILDIIWSETRKRAICRIVIVIRRWAARQQGGSSASAACAMRWVHELQAGRCAEVRLRGGGGTGTVQPCVGTGCMAWLVVARSPSVLCVSVPMPKFWVKVSSRSLDFLVSQTNPQAFNFQVSTL